MDDLNAAAELDRCLASGGVALIPTDTVYGLACDARNADALNKLYELKGRPPRKPSALLFFSLESAFTHLPQLIGRLRLACEALLPGPVTLILPNPNESFPLAYAGGEPSLGLRVPSLVKGVAALKTVATPILQSSANLSGDNDPRSLAEVPASIRSQVDFELDGGALPGVSSTVVDLRQFVTQQKLNIVRQGALTEEAVYMKLRSIISSSVAK